MPVNMSEEQAESFLGLLHAPTPKDCLCTHRDNSRQKDVPWGRGNTHAAHREKRAQEDQTPFFSQAGYFKLLKSIPLLT